MKNINNYAFYLVTESNLSQGRSNEDIVRASIKGGAEIIQLREKDWSKKKYKKEAEKLAKICKEHNVLFVVNDYPDIAKAVNADGLHLGQEDMPIKEARNITGKNILIGKSTHSREQALAAEKEGADYISIGPVYPTRKKPNPVTPDLVRVLAPILKIPFVVIGGIKLHNLEPVLEAGAKTVAVISAIVEADNVEQETKKFIEIIKQKRS